VSKGLIGPSVVKRSGYVDLSVKNHHHWPLEAKVTRLKCDKNVKILFKNYYFSLFPTQLGQKTKEKIISVLKYYKYIHERIPCIREIIGFDTIKALKKLCENYIFFVILEKTLV
jgi:hypothetical protein